MRRCKGRCRCPHGKNQRSTNRSGSRQSVQKIDTIKFSEVFANKVRDVLGKDPYVDIQTPYAKDGITHIDLVVEYSKKAKALATLLNKRYKHKKEVIEINVFIKDTDQPAKEYEEPIESKQLYYMLECALDSNPYYVEAIPITYMNETEKWGDISVVVKKDIVQYISGERDGIYSYSNEVAEDVFNELIKRKYSENLAITFSTQINED